MNLQSILLFLITLLLVIISAWSLSTFLRLNRAKGQYKTDKVLQTACQVSKMYVSTGLSVATVSTILSLIILLLVSWNLYKNY